ncbi:MAG: sporulation protein YqfC [Firmicutes bacterium]|nr:sporulation protein YqfC [Bacillota bacterium]
MSIKDHKEQVQQTVAGLFDLPRDIALNLPKVVIIGNIQVFVENHRGIIEYAPEKVRISINRGELEIRGSQLVLRNILADEIALDGKIEAVTFRE